MLRCWNEEGERREPMQKLISPFSQTGIDCFESLLKPTAHQATMENDKGELVELYIPRKCSATNRIIKAKDHASVQLAIANVDSEGRAIPDSNTLYALSGFVRSKGESDDQINRLAQQDGLLNNVWSYSR